MIKALIGGGMYLLFVMGIILKWQSNRKSKENKKAIGADAVVYNDLSSMDPIEALSSSQWQVRLKAVQHLREHPVDEAIPNLMTLLNDVDPDVRQVTIEALIAIGEKVIEPTVTTLKNGALDARVASVHVLTQLNSSESLDALSHALLHDESVWVRLPAAQAITAYPAEQSVEILSQALNDKNREVYDEVVVCLKRLGTPEAQQAIESSTYQANHTQDSDQRFLTS